MKAVFDTKPTSRYDDEASQHYQFPRRYRSIVSKTVGDWVVLRRPRADGGNMGYFAVARVSRIEPDTVEPALNYARLSDYLIFDEPVPWTKDGRYWEESLRTIPQPQVGVFLRGKSVRALSESDFSALLHEGLRTTLALEKSERLQLASGLPIELRQAFDSPLGERNWRIETILTSRIIREARFRSVVCDAYDSRCAVTRLRMFDHQGNSEAQAAHIWAVAEGGPDVVQNGIALSATVHWLFDRHLISFTDDYRLLVADRVPSQIRGLLEGCDERLHLPSDPKYWPHPRYLAKHRSQFMAQPGFN